MNHLGFSGIVEAVSVDGPRLPLGVRDQVAYESVHLELAKGDRLSSCAAIQASWGGRTTIHRRSP